jgi:predicted nucleic acid-binding protein
MERKMKTKRVYVDSTVVYGAPAKEFSQDSKRFWDAFRNGEFIIIASDVLRIEMERAPAHIHNLFKALPESQIERVESTEESNTLAAQYIAKAVVGESNFDDCRHIALSTISHADVLVSWNFRHMIYRRAGYNDVNEKLGYPRIAIQTPEKFMEASYDEN